MDPQELVPLESGLRAPRGVHGTRNCYLAPRTCYTVPLRLCRLLSLLICLPCLFLMVPLYLRYRVYSGQMYPMSMTDMRLIDSKISPTWCQTQVVRSNTTFNAFVVPGQPELTEDLVPVSMTRELELEDDMKEYWGFYLLKGSSVTVSACVRELELEDDMKEYWGFYLLKGSSVTVSACVSYPGASLIMIKGYKHLQECAYIGDDSSEEVDEIMEAYSLGLMSEAAKDEKLKELGFVKGKTNDPDTMRRHKSGVSFHDPNKKENETSSPSADSLATVDVTDHDPKELREILERLHALREAAKAQIAKNYKPPPNLMELHAANRHRDVNVDKNERNNLVFQDLNGNSSIVPITSENNSTETGPKNVADNIFVGTNHNDTKVKFNNTVVDTKLDTVKDDVKNIEEGTEILGEETDINEEETTVRTEDSREVEDNDEGLEDNSLMEVTEVAEVFTSVQNPTEPNSKEVFEDVLHMLQALGDKGKRVLIKLHKSMGVEYQDKATSKPKTDIMSVVTGSGEELDRLRKVLVEAIDEEKNRGEREQKRRDAVEQARRKRESMLPRIELVKEFNENDEERNHAAEEDVDGYADTHVKVNETSPLDMSNSEFWSSFSSSEEALLECEGLILNLPLTPHKHCHKGASEAEGTTAAKANALTYRVPANGYYFFVFNSENEMQVNYIRARFDLQKTKYDVARTKLRECTNSTERCDLSLDIFSSQKVVLEVPLRNNDSLWNEQFVIISECEPRTSVYIACVIAVPILILVFAHQ
ncbi:hypothetical protein PYW07_010373 [Mythimna separata]|uniref:E3 ubiquitin-protein ligase APD1-4 middle domain-containing protein n=1 Tax=Mythimna separata TaxID=271217 RepID=A0AAD7YA28_MYTSE|nr:hypothetical protein PYW07_010373 [Mythimna separata]